jgi:NAD(P)-dependent dehydrogenase (short-subunit alcohol dehydrogenase family)
MSQSTRPVLVTGASSGIGRATVELLSSLGFPTFAGARKQADLDSLKRLVNVTPLSLDVTRPEDVRRAAAIVRESGRGLYGLVNNAGITNMGPLAEMTVEELHQVLAVNLDGVHRMVNAMFPFLRESRGRVVNVSSIGGFLVEPLLGPYFISKHAVEAYTDVLREEVAPLGVHVVTVEPGDFQSSIFENGLTRFGDEIRRKWTGSDSVFREQVFHTLEFLEKRRNRIEFPLPLPVAEAVANALVLDDPKPRYLVGTPTEARRVVDRLLSLAYEVNSSHPAGMSHEELVRSLDKLDGN